MPASLPRRAAAALVAGLLALTACAGDDDPDVADGVPIGDDGTPAPDEAGDVDDPDGTDEPDDADEPATAEGYPPQPEGVPFPDADWPEGELPADAVARLDELADAAFEVAGEDAIGEVSSIVVIHGGELVYERYNPAFDADTVHPSWSMAKTFTAAMVGLAVEDGLLSVDDDHLREEWAEDDPRSAITIEDLLHMASGLEWTEGVGYSEFFGQSDAAGWYATRELVAEPGTRFNYSTPETAMLAREVAEALGGCEEQEAFLQERLLDPIGITTEELVRDGTGCWYGGLGMNMTTRDFARFGLLLLRGGIWDGEQVLPTEWIDAMREPSPAFPGYGYQTWLVDDDAFAARGFQGQSIVVVPEDDLVIAWNNRNGDACPLVSTVLEVVGSDVSTC